MDTHEKMRFFHFVIGRNDFGIETYTRDNDLEVRKGHA